MYAVVKTGGKQYRVQEGDELNIARLSDEEGSEVTFGEVLLVGGEGAETKIGRPLLDGASVKATVVRHARDRKIIIFKHRRRKNYRKKQGHRQPYTRVRITDISA